MKKTTEFDLSLREIFSVLRNKKGKIFLFTLLFGLLFLSFALFRPIRYDAEASFKEKISRSSEMNGSSLASLLMNGLESDGKNEAKSMMRSKKILRNVVETLDLQAFIELYDAPFFLIENTQNNFFVEKNYLTGKRRLAIADPSPGIYAHHVSFSSEIPLTLELLFVDELHFQVINKTFNNVGSGEIALPFIKNEYAFTIEKFANASLTGKKYILNLIPLAEVMEGLVKNIELKADKDDSSLLILRYRDRNRHKAAQVLNTLMSSYQDYLKKEQERVSGEQIHYLTKREEQIETELEEALELYAKKVSSELSTVGYADSQRAIDFLSGQFQQIQKKRESIDLELQKLKRALEHPQEVLADVYLNSENSKFFLRLIEQINQLKQQKATLDLLIEDPMQIIDKAEEERFFGATLDSNEKLYLSYHKQLADIENQLLQFHFLIDELQNSEFDMSALSALTLDAETQKLITEASSLTLALQDDLNRSQKEKERIKNDLEIKRRFLLLHLKESSTLLKLHKELVEEKLRSLQRAQKELIDQQISILEKQLRNGIKVHVENLKKEQRLLSQRQSVLKKEMTTLPKKWMHEKLLEQKLTMNSRMVEEMAKIVESKNISANLDVVQSSPIDFAMAPIHPVRPHLALFFLIGALIGSILSSVVLVAKAAALRIDDI